MGEWVESSAQGWISEWERHFFSMLHHRLEERWGKDYEEEKDIKQSIEGLILCLKVLNQLSQWNSVMVLWDEKAVIAQVKTDIALVAGVQEDFGCYWMDTTVIMPCYEDENFECRCCRVGGPNFRVLLCFQIIWQRHLNVKFTTSPIWWWCPWVNWSWLHPPAPQEWVCIEWNLTTLLCIVYSRPLSCRVDKAVTSFLFGSPSRVGCNWVAWPEVAYLTPAPKLGGFGYEPALVLYRIA